MTDEGFRFPCIKDIVAVGLDVAVRIATDAGAGKITEEVDERIDDERR